MKNLKRILSLALASVMVMGMMVVGASAAFNDQADINALNADAVNTMVALKIISGKEGNKFDPTGKVTRAEMATMIAMALNGGNADFRGTTTTGFTDVDGVRHWAAKFIKYCVDQGILSGVGGGKFNPDANVTAQEAATMILTAMGYKKEMLKSETSDWAAKINLTAEQRNLYDDTKVTDYTQDVDRETAAQMVFNGITVWTPVINDTYNTTTGEHMYSVDGSKANPSILTTAFKAQMEYAILANTAYDAETETYTYTLDSSNIDVEPLNGTHKANNIKVTFAQDVSELFMQKVKVIYSDSSNQANPKSTIIGINKALDGVLGSGVGAPSTRGGKLDGKPKADTCANVNFNGVTATKQDWWTYDLIDNTGDGKVNAVVYHPITVGKVNVVNNTQVSFSNGVAAVPLKDNEVETGLKRDDLVTITTDVTGVKIVKKMDVVEDVTATALDKDGVYTIGGEQYEKATGYSSTITLGKSYNLSVLNGYIFAAESTVGSTAAGLNDLIYAIEVGPVNDGLTEVDNTDTTNKAQKVRFMFANGDTTAVKTVVSLGVVGGSGADKNDPKPLDSSNNKVEEGKFYTFKANKNGTYALMPVDVNDNNTDFADMTCNAVSSNAIKSGVMDGIRFNDDAVVFVKNTYTPAGGTATTQYKMFTGKEINGWEDLSGKTAILWTVKSSGFDYTVVGSIDLGNNAKDAWPGAAANGDHFGYLVANADRAYVAALEDEYTRLTIWDGEEVITRYVDEPSLINRAAGTIVRYKEAADDTITLIATNNATTPWTSKPVAVSAYAGGDTIQFIGGAETGDYSLEHAAIIYVDAAKKAKADASAITLAAAVDPTDLSFGYYNNAYLVEGTKNATTGITPVLALIVDVNNGLGATSVSGNAGNKVTLDNVLGATANFPAVTETDKTVKVAPGAKLTNEKVMEGGVQLFDVAQELSGATYSKEAAIVKIVIPGMKQGDKITVNGTAKTLDADATFYLIVGNQNATTANAANKGTISVTISYEAAKAAGGFDTAVNYTLQYDAWGEKK